MSAPQRGLRWPACTGASDFGVVRPLVRPRCALPACHSMLFLPNSLAVVTVDADAANASNSPSGLSSLRSAGRLEASPAGGHSEKNSQINTKAPNELFKKQFLCASQFFKFFSYVPKTQAKMIIYCPVSHNSGSNTMDKDRCTNNAQEIEHCAFPHGLCSQPGSTYLDHLVCRPALMTPVCHAQEISPRPRKHLKHMNPTLADKPAPVLITRPLLDSLRGLSLPKAASTIGVSATAFKRACRSLGVVRWDFTRGPARRKRGSGRRADQSGAESCDSGPAPSCDSPIPCSPGWDDPADDIVVPCGNFAWSSIEAAETENLWMADEEPEADDALVLEMLSRPWPA